MVSSKVKRKEAKEISKNRLPFPSSNKRLRLYKLISDGSNYIKLYKTFLKGIAEHYMNNLRISATAETPSEWIDS